MKSCYLGPLCPCLAIRERTPRLKVNSLAAAGAQSRRRSSFPSRSRTGFTRLAGKSSAWCQGLHSSAGSRHSGDNFPGAQHPTPPMRAANTLSPPAASQESTNPNKYLRSPCLLLTPLRGNASPSPDPKHPSSGINNGIGSQYDARWLLSLPA